MDTEKTPKTAESLGSGEGMVDSAVRDTGSYLAKSFAVFLLSLTSLALTGLGWVFKGLGIFFGALSKGSFLGAGKLHTVMTRVKWHEKNEDKD